MTQRKTLPIGVQTFREIREDNHYYVDKTQLILDLIDDVKHCFLSRPRRFGKSLLVDTIKELFEGNEALFNGLAAHAQWDWSVQHPVLRFSFGSDRFRAEEGLDKSLNAQLTYLERQYELTPTFDHIEGRFSELILHAHKTHGQRVVILVDEYDKPILDTLQTPELARKNRDILRGFYGAIKDYDAHICFSFLTGVSKFSKVSIFSGLNNLYDLTLVPAYSTLCGYTDHDIDTVFAAELPGLDRGKVREWYNGYHWRGEGVYNPFDILQLFKNREYRAYWFETGTPTFLLEELLKRQVNSLQLGNMLSSSSMLSSFDVDDMTTEALLFQTGYLTIHNERQAGGQVFYTLGYPNLEVYQSLNESLLGALTQNRSAQAQQTLRLHDLLLANDFDGLKTLFHSFFASIPHAWYTRNDIQNYEGYYASVFYSYFASLGLDVTVEDMTNLGRLDMTLRFNAQIYIFEFKVVEDVPEGKALQQIKDKAYADKYRAAGQPIHLVGVEFSRETRNILGFEVERGV